MSSEELGKLAKEELFFIAEKELNVLLASLSHSEKRTSPSTFSVLDEHGKTTFKDVEELLPEEFFLVASIGIGDFSWAFPLVADL